MKTSIAKIVVDQIIDGLKEGKIPREKTRLSKGQWTKNSLGMKVVYSSYKLIS